MPLRKDQKIDAGDLDGIPVGVKPADVVDPKTGDRIPQPDTRPRSRPIKTTRAEGERYLLEELDDGRWAVTISKPAGMIQYIATPELVRECIATDAHPDDRAALAAALPEKIEAEIERVR